MISIQQDRIDGFVNIHTIDVASLHVWWKALLLIISNLAAIPAIAVSIVLGFYVWAYAIFISMFVSIFYHLCQTTDYCIFEMPLDSWQRIDHITASFMLAMSILLFYIYRPGKKTKALTKQIKTKNLNYNDFLLDMVEPDKKKRKKKLGPKDNLYFDDSLSSKDKNKICFGCRGLNPHMVFDWQSIFLIFTYIFVIIITIQAIPLTTQSFLIILIFGIIFSLVKIFIIEEGNPEYLHNRFHFPNLIAGTVLVIFGLIFYFIDAYIEYWLFHSFWHFFVYIGVLYVFIGTTYDIPGWFDSKDIFIFLWQKIKFLFQIFNCFCSCCKTKKTKIKYMPNYHEEEEIDDEDYYRRKTILKSKKNNVV
jgi:hypothetical protein